MASVPAVTAAKSVDLVINQGSTFSRSCQLYFTTPGDVSLTGCTVTAKIRANFANPGAGVIATFSVDTSLLASGQWTISLTVAQTAALAVPSGTADDVRVVSIGDWDLEITDGTSTYRYFEGSVSLSRKVTF